MNKPLRNILSLLFSKTATVWLSGFFIIYYLAKTIWSTEAFASLIGNLSSNNLFRCAYLLFVLNVTGRIVSKAGKMWPRKSVFFLRMPLLAGVIVFLVSFFMSLNVRESGQALVADGNPVDIPWENSVYHVAAVDSALEKHALRADEALIFDYEPRIRLTDAAGGRYDIGAFPPKQIQSTYMHILNFGIAPGVELRRSGELLSNGYIPLRLTPYGTIDSFELKPSPYKFFMNILPTRIIKSGREAAREYDLSNPRYGIEVRRGDTMIAKGETDRTISFDEAVSLSFSPPTDWVLLELVYDPFLKPLVIGMFLVLLGMVLYPFSYLVRF